MTDSVEPTVELALNEAVEILKKMQDRWIITSSGLIINELPSEEVLTRIARYSHYIKHGTETIETIAVLGEHFDNLPSIPQSEELSHDFQWGGFALAAINFLRIPFLYLSAYLLKKPIPFTLSNNTRFLYSSIFLALTITAIILPVAAPIIGLTLASMGFIASSFILVKMLTKRYQLDREAKRLTRVIARAEDEMEKILAEAKAMQYELEKTEDRDHLKEVIHHIAILEEQYDKQEAILEELYLKRIKNSLRKEKQDINKVIFRSLALILTTLSIIGLILALFVPPVGLGIIAAVAVVSASYLAGRLTYAAVQWGRAWFNNKTKAVTQQIVSDEHELSLKEEKHHEHDIGLAETIDREGSTAEVLRELTEDVPLSPVKNVPPKREEFSPGDNLTSNRLFSPTPKYRPKKGHDDGLDEGEGENEELSNH